METPQNTAKGFVMRLRGRYIALAAALAIIPLALIMLVLHRDVQARFEKQQDSMLQESIALIASNLTHRFDLILGQMRTLAGLAPMPGLSPAPDDAAIDPVDGSSAQVWMDAHAALFREFGAHDPRILSLRLVSPEGQVWVREDLRKGMPLAAEMRPVIESADDPAFQNARRLPEGTAFVSQLLRPRTQEATEEGLISIGMPVYREGQTRAVLVADLSAAQVFAQAAGTVHSSQFILADAKGQYVARSGAGVPNRPAAASLFADWPGLDPRNLDTIQHSLSMGSVMIARLIDVNPKGAASFWMIGAVKNGNAIATMLKELGSIAAQWAIILGVLALSVALLMADLISKPITVLVSTARRVRGGDLTARAPVERSDEIGDLARSFNTMLDSVQEKNQSLEDARQRAEALARAKSEFLANMGPDIRAPMNGTLGMLELLSRTELNAEQRGFLRAGTSSAETLDKVLNDVLDFAQIEAGRLSIEHVVFDLRRLTEECTTSLSHRAQEKKLQLLSFVPAEIPAQVVGDPTRIRRVLMHLLGNAIKFTQRGEVSLSLRANPEPGGRYMIRFDIKDTGIGMTDEQRLKWSAPRTGKSTVRSNDGRGLGTVVCRRFVELMNGEMGVDSKAGRGSLFWFEIPVRNADASAPVPPPHGDMGMIPMSLMKPSHSSNVTESIAVAAGSTASTEGSE